MPTIKNAEVFSQDSRVAAPVLAALADIAAQRVPRDFGKLLRRISRTIDSQIADIEAERKRLITAYAKRNAEGEPVKVESDNDIGDLNALNVAVAALMAETFEVEGIPEGLIEGFPLRGSTWVSPIVVVAEDGKAEKPEKKEESAGE